MTEYLNEYRRAWDKKPTLRLVYSDIYDRIVGLCKPGPTLEIGGGIGQLKARIPDLVATDIQAAPWLDVVTDAQQLPFRDGSFDNIVMVDVLHHIEYPALFLREAERVLRQGGLCIMVEPAITWGSTLFYRFLHQEPVRMRADPLAVGYPDPTRDPYDSNQAIPTLLVTRDRRRFNKLFPSLTVEKVDWFSFLVYPMSGGFKSWSLLPEMLGRYGLTLEKKLEKSIGYLLAFRLLAVVRKGER